MQRGDKVKFSSLSVSLTPFLVEEENKMEEPCKLQRKRVGGWIYKGEKCRQDEKNEKGER
jgi:hypothetical protein